MDTHHSHQFDPEFRSCYPFITAILSFISMGEQVRQQLNTSPRSLWLDNIGSSACIHLKQTQTLHNRNGNRLWLHCGWSQVHFSPERGPCRRALCKVQPPLTKYLSWSYIFARRLLVPCSNGSHSLWSWSFTKSNLLRAQSLSS